MFDIEELRLAGVTRGRSGAVVVIVVFRTGGLVVIVAAAAVTVFRSTGGFLSTAVVDLFSGGLTLDDAGNECLEWPVVVL